MYASKVDVEQHNYTLTSCFRSLGEQGWGRGWRIQGAVQYNTRNIGSGPAIEV